MMKVYELLTVYRKLFAAMARQGISTEDIMYLDLFNEYRTMIADGQKTASVCQLLSRKYKVSVSTVKMAIKRLDKEYEL